MRLCGLQRPGTLLPSFLLRDKIFVFFFLYSTRLASLPAECSARGTYATGHPWFSLRRRSNAWLQFGLWQKTQAARKREGRTAPLSHHHLAEALQQCLFHIIHPCRHSEPRPLFWPPRSREALNSQGIGKVWFIAPDIVWVSPSIDLRARQWALPDSPCSSLECRATCETRRPARHFDAELIHEAGALLCGRVSPLAFNGRERNGASQNALTQA